MSVSRLHDSRLMRAVFLGLGIVALLLAVAGIFLPMLPTTPFVLLAAACFARGSEYLHDKMLAHRIAGPIIREWHEHRSMPPGVKPWAFLLIGLSFGASILLMETPWHRAMLAAIGIVLAFFLWRVPVRRN
ncbi:MAG: YbaN family protein [Pseudomonadota bacterium]|nr:YbaN family protein [Gammaproteobacteria bacterium]MBU1732103.1 YbaN family protein [Gammaproteobacteria bacterium]MBU1893367.1 YbaN family protein [Gammaproteobacteria bacterium]